MDEKIISIIIGLIIFAVGVVFIGAGSALEGASQGVLMIIGLATMAGGAIVFYKGAK